MLIIIAIVLVVISLLLFMSSKKNLKKYLDLKQSFQELESSKKTEILALENDKKTLDIFLIEQKNRNTELQEENKLGILELKQELIQERVKNEKYIDEIKECKAQISKLDTQLIEQQKAIDEKIALFKDNEQKLKIEFENLANKIFENKAKQFGEQNKESLNNILNPVQQQLKDFKQKVEDVYDKESNARSALQQELKSLKELNQKMSSEAYNLTNALKGNSKHQGVWGEMVLENVLEKSGLREGQEYYREVSLKDEQNITFRPDVVVKLPNDRDIIIDAKTSLAAYNEYMAADNLDEKKSHLKNHIKSIKEHIKGLANKDYEKLQNVNSLDFIFMFMPIEGALLLALDNDPSLYDDAFKKKIILVSPTTLLVALRAVENTWRYEKQAQSIVAVYDRATKLYDKVAGLIETFEKVGNSITRANKEYETAFKQLQGNGGLISQATMLKKVANIKPKKEIKVDLKDSTLE